MKKQLVLLSLLVGAVSLWGMEVDPESRMKFMQALDRPEFKDKLSLDLFEKFHQKAFEYFKTDQTEEKRLEILTWIKDWLPLINIEYEKDERNTVNAFLTYPQLINRVLNNFADAEGFFAMIYMRYLESHPNELCGVLSKYFDLNVMNNKYYRSFLEITLRILESFAEENFSSPSIGNQPQTWHEIFAPIRGYVLYFEAAREKTTLFGKYKLMISFICDQLQNVLQVQQTEKPEIAAPSPADEELQEPLAEEQTEEKLESPDAILPSENATRDTDEQPITLPGPKQTTNVIEPESNEANPEPTFWDKLADGWNRFLNMLKIMGGV